MKRKRLDPMERKRRDKEKHPMNMSRSCGTRCKLKIDDFTREYIHSEFWVCDEQARSYWIINMVGTKSPTRRRRYTQDAVDRKSTRIYHLYGNGTRDYVSANGCFSQP